MDYESGSRYPVHNPYFFALKSELEELLAIVAGREAGIVFKIFAKERLRGEDDCDSCGC